MSLQVEVVRDQHELAGREILAHPAACIRGDKGAGAEAPEHPHAEDGPVGGMTFVEVCTPFHHGERHARERSDHERPRVSERRRNGPARNLAVRDLDGVLDAVGEAAETGAQDHRRPRNEGRARRG